MEAKVPASLPDLSSLLAARAARLRKTAKPPQPHAHLGVLEQIKQKDASTLKRAESPELESYRQILEDYWGIIARPVATYTLKRSCLVVCEEGVYELNESYEHCRYRGKDDVMEDGEWIYYDKYLESPDTPEPESSDLEGCDKVVKD